MTKDREAKRPMPFTFIDQSAATGSSTRQRRSLIQRHIAIQTRDQKRRLEKEAAKKPQGWPDRNPALQGAGRKRSYRDGSEVIDEETRGALMASTQSSLGTVSSSEPFSTFHSFPTPPDTTPFDIFLSGGRIDPFNSLNVPAENSRELELMDYLTNVIWPGFSHLGSGVLRNPYAARWLKRSYANPALRHALLMASSIHLSTGIVATSSAAQHQELVREQLYHQNEAIRYVRELLGNANFGDINDMLMVVICLATNVVRHTDPAALRDPNPFSPPLRSGGWIDIYGTWDFSDIHWNALLNIVRNAGGITQIREYGIPFLISYADTLQSAALAKRPLFPLMSPTGNGVQVVFESLEDLLGPSHQHLLSQIIDFTRPPGRGFDFLKTLNCCDGEHLGAFKDLANYTASLRAYNEGFLSHMAMTRIIDSRNVATHNICSLPSAEEIKTADAAREADSQRSGVWDAGQERRNMGLYESVRLAALLYNVLVTFPLPRTQFVRDFLSQGLKESLDTLDPKYCAQRACGEAKLWCMFIAGCSAHGTADEEWWMEKIVQLASHIEIETWSDCKDILEKYLWLKCACSKAGQDLWERAWRRIGVSVS